MPPSVEWLISSKKIPQRVGESRWPGLSASTVMLAAARAERGMAAQAAQVIASPRFPAPLRLSHVLAFSGLWQAPPPATPFDALPRVAAPATTGMAQPGAPAAT